MNIHDLIPPRRDEDILAQRVRLVLGGEVYDLLALNIEDTEAWIVRMDLYLLRLLGSIKDDDLPGEVITALTGQSGKLIDLLVAYDKRSVLPMKAELRRLMTPLELFIAVLEVWRAANPLVDIATDGIQKPEEKAASRGRTSSPRRSTDGPPATSVAN